MHLRTVALVLGLVVVIGGSVALISPGAIPGLPSWWKAKAVPGGAVTEAFEGHVDTLNPIFANSQNSREVDSLIYEGLTRVGPKSEFLPSLASHWSASEDGKVYLFDIRTDVKWADGKRLTLDDVLFTFSVLKDPKYGQDPQYDLAAARFWKDVAVEASGPNQVKFTLKDPSSSFPLLLSPSAPAPFGVIAKHLFKGGDPEVVRSDIHSSEKALGTGPFMVQSIAEAGTKVRLVRNPNARNKAYLQNFVFRGYPTLDEAADAVNLGDADAVGGLLSNQAALLRKRGSLDIKDIHTFGTSAVLFNLRAGKAPALIDLNVRQALVQAVDRQRIIDGVLGGFADPAPGPIPPTSWAYSNEESRKFGYDPRASMAALDQAGWTLNGKSVRTNKDGKSLQLTLVAPNVEPYTRVADALSQQMGQVGVKLVVNKVPSGTQYADTLNGNTQNGIGVDYDLILASFDNDPDPDEFDLWHSAPAGSTQGTLDLAHLPRMGEYNTQNFVNKDLSEGRRQKDRLPPYQHFQRLMADVAPAIFLYEPHFVYALSRRVQGFVTNPAIEPSERLEYVAQWYVITSRF